MKLSITIVLSAIVFASASDVSVHVFDNVNFNDDNGSAVLTLPSGSCHGLGSGWDNRISSVAPAPGVICILFAGENCNGESVHDIVAPGILNLGDPQYGFLDQASSLICSLS